MTAFMQCGCVALALLTTALAWGNNTVSTACRAGAGVPEEAHILLVMFKGAG